MALHADTRGQAVSLPVPGRLPQLPLPMPMFRPDRRPPSSIHLLRLPGAVQIGEKLNTTERKYAICFSNGNHGIVEATEVQLPGVGEYLGDHINFWRSEEDGTSTLLLAIDSDLVDRIELVTPDMELQAQRLFEGIQSLASFFKFVGPCPDPNCTQCKPQAGPGYIGPPVAEQALDEADQILAEALRDNRGKPVEAVEADEEVSGEPMPLLPQNLVQQPGDGS
jgi:hypothetical protein